MVEKSPNKTAAQDAPRTPERETSEPATAKKPSDVRYDFCPPAVQDGLVDLPEHLDDNNK
ncbi:hypothetical protein ACFTWH_32975 [Streptomyces sp. NPDC057011]